MSEELSAAIFALSQVCRSGAGLIPTDVGKFADQKSSKVFFSEVNNICDRLNILSKDALERHVTQAEFIVEQAQLEAIGAFPGGSTYSAVQSAFARQGPPWS